MSGEQRLRANTDYSIYAARMPFRRYWIWRIRFRLHLTRRSPRLYR